MSEGRIKLLPVIAYWTRTSLVGNSLDFANMERQLIVMRHAKSSWASAGLTDHERPLNGRGERDAPRVAAQLTALGWQPQHVRSSDARRTRETAKLMLEEWEDGIEATFVASLYLAGPAALKEAMMGLSDEVESLVVLGHNPGWEGVVHRLTGVDVTMKTATAALLRSDCESWEDAFDVEWSLEEVVYPRELD